MVAATACAATQPQDRTASAAGVTSTSSPAPAPSTSVRTQPSTSQPTIEEHHVVTTIRITVAGQTLTAQLADHPTAQDLARQLPLTLNFRDFNRVEKVAELPQPLTMEGVPDGDDPEINDIGYYAPSRSLVFYYGDVGYWSGIVRIGHFRASDIDLIERQPDGFDVTIEQAP
jgi:hypothetical protein